MRGLVGKAFFRAWVEQGFDALNILGCEFFEVPAFEKVLADQAVGIFVGAAFPRRVGKGEVGFGFELFCQVGVAGELFAVVEGHRLHCLSEGTEGVEHSLGDGGGFCTVHQGDQGVTTLALHHRHQHTTPEPSYDGIHFPICYSRPFFHDGGTLINHHLIFDPRALLAARSAFAIGFAAMPQGGLAFGSLVPADVLIDGFMADVTNALFAERETDLLWIDRSKAWLPRLVGGQAERFFPPTHACPFPSGL